MMFLNKILWKSASHISVEVLSTWQFCDSSSDSVASNTMTSIRSYFSGSKASDSDRIIRPWIQAAADAVREFWIDEYRGKFAGGAPTPSHISKAPVLNEKSFTSIRNHKHLKLRISRTSYG